MDFYNDRQPKLWDESERDLVFDPEIGKLDRGGLRAANTRIRNATPLYRQGDLNTRIRTAAVQRHRARKAGSEDFSTMGEYMNFICGSDDGSQ